jgi:hypothetical protein
MRQKNEIVHSSRRLDIIKTEHLILRLKISSEARRQDIIKKVSCEAVESHLILRLNVSGAALRQDIIKTPGVITLFVTSHTSALGKDLCRSGGVFRDVKLLLNGSSRILLKIKVVCEVVESRKLYVTLRRDGAGYY